MRNVRFIVTAGAVLCAGLLGMSSAPGQSPGEKPTNVIFFDILDVPARVDEPKLRKVKDSYRLNCAIANRSEERLLGLRFVLMLVDSRGNLRWSLQWNEEAVLAGSSIKTFEFRPPVVDKIRSNDSLFLSVDEVVGNETIWHVRDTDKALRAYSRGQHDVVPTVTRVANKDDRQK